MTLIIHELSHVIVSFLIATSIIIYFKNKFADNHKISIIISALAGGVFVDLDHFLDYFIAFGTNFNIRYFLAGYQFLKSDLIIVPVHSFELVLILLVYSWWLSKKKQHILTTIIIVTFAISLLSHLVIDVYSNDLPPKSYLFLYRSSNNFQLKDLVYPSHYLKHLNQKTLIRLE